MATITPALISAINTQYNGLYQRGYKGIEPWYSKVATEVTSASSSVTYPFIAKIPRVRQWLGERVLNNLAAYSYVLQNLDYELTVEVERNVIEDDIWGLYNSEFEMMGRQMAKWPDDLITSLLRTGQASKCYDGQNFFDTSHPISATTAYNIAGSQRNYWSTGMALTAANIDTVRSTMLGWLGEDQKPFGIVPNLLVVPPQLEFTARTIVKATTNQYGATNVYNGLVDVLMIPELGLDPTTWYLLATDGPVKPFVFQIRRAPTLLRKDQVTDDNVFWHKKYVYGADMRGNAGFGLWFTAAKAVA